MKMEKNKSKAQRLHNTKVALEKSIRKEKAFAHYYFEGSVRSDEYQKEVKQRARKVRDHLKSCSCSMCGNPRKFYCGKNSLTLSEIKALDFYADSLKEAALD